MNVDFLKQPIKVGDFVTCLDKHYQVLQIGMILDITEKTILLLRVRSEGNFKRVLSDYKKSQKFSYGSTYRTSHDCIVFIPKDNERLKTAVSEKELECSYEILGMYTALSQAKKPSTKKSNLKI